MKFTILEEGVLVYITMNSYFLLDVWRYMYSREEDFEKWSNIDYLIGPAPRALVEQESKFTIYLT